MNSFLKDFRIKSSPLLEVRFISGKRDSWLKISPFAGV
jgi:hypothetical protein